MSDYAVDRLAPGDHVCWIYGRDDEYLPAIARFVAGGLKERQRVVYLTGVVWVPGLRLADGAYHRPGASQ
jgi:DcmR-like sensory protein